MRFPILNVTEECWNLGYTPDNLILFEPWIYNDNDRIFRLLFKDKVFCDCDGQLFRVTSKKAVHSWRRLFKFLPNFNRADLKFRKVDREMSLDELRTFVDDKFSDSEWKALLQRAKNHGEIIDGTS